MPELRSGQVFHALCGDATDAGKSRDNDNMTNAVCPEYIHTTHYRILWLQSNYLFKKVPTSDAAHVLMAFIRLPKHPLGTDQTECVF